MYFCDSLLCSLIGNYFAQVVPYNKGLTLEIMRELYASTLDGYLAEAKLLEKKFKRFAGRRRLMTSSSLKGIYCISRVIVQYRTAHWLTIATSTSSSTFWQGDSGLDSVIYLYYMKAKCSVYF